MSENVYKGIYSVTLNGYNENSNYELNSIISCNEDDYEMIIESYSYIEELKRGWTGDLYYYTKGYSEPLYDKEVTSAACLKDVLLARVTVSSEPNCAVVWKYTFLKD